MEDTYAGPRTDNEYNRLRLQHDFIKYAMNGELVFAPIDVSKPFLHVLDSATGDGYWLVDLSSNMHTTSKLVGADIAPQHFIPRSELPDQVELINHDICHTWPASFHNHFDLVHQRFVLMAANDTNTTKAIQNLVDCVRPGGWIQLHDGDMDTIEEGDEHRAMMKFREIARTGWQMLGFNLSPGPKLNEWLKERGLINLEERVLNVKCGKSSSDVGQGEKLVQMLLGHSTICPGLRAVCRLTFFLLKPCIVSR